MPRTATEKWTNSSVRALAGTEDPVVAVVRAARSIIADALDHGWAGPPFDPIELADQLRIRVVPRGDVKDARTVPQPNGRIAIEFNPHRSRGRQRYSIAHELGHSLFPDCAERVRNRAAHHELQGDDWQLEVLCNIAAAEFLMPAGSFSVPDSAVLGIDDLLALRAKFDVSTEALLIHAIRQTGLEATMFVASRAAGNGARTRFKIDYAIPSPSWTGPLKRGHVLPATTVVADCSGIGFTAKGDERWVKSSPRLRIECVGIPGYPGRREPRVAGIALASRANKTEPIVRLRGDAVDPKAHGHKIVAHVVNDSTSNWSPRGFAGAVRKKWPSAQEQFRDWTLETGKRPQLGTVHLAEVEEDVSVATLVAQRGYGPSSKPRIRYRALADGLRQVAEAARNLNASVHLPRIGCGQAGGSWDVVRDLILAEVCSQRVPVYLYDLPGRDPPRPPQQALPFGMLADR